MYIMTHHVFFSQIIELFNLVFMILSKGDPETCNVLWHFILLMYLTPSISKIGNGFVLLIKMGNSIRLKWVNELSK